jgi:hypothetical protein
MRSWLLNSSQHLRRWAKPFEFMRSITAFPARNARSPRRCARAQIAFAIAAASIGGGQRVVVRFGAALHGDLQRALLQASLCATTLVSWQTRLMRCYCRP